MTEAAQHGTSHGPAGPVVAVLPDATALGEIATRYVAVGPVADDRLEALRKHAERLRAATGVADEVGPLPILTGHDDAGLLAACAQRLHADGRRSAAVDDYLTMLPLRAVTASLHGLDVDAERATVRLVGSCRRGGTDGDRPADQSVALRLRCGRTVLDVPTIAVQRHEDGMPRWIGFVAEVPLADLPVGRSDVAVVVRTPDGHDDVTLPLRASIGALLDSHAWSAGERRVQVVPLGGTDHSVLVVASGRDAEPRRWDAAMRRLDLRSMARRRPFAWVRWARWLTRPLVGRGPIWIVGERTDTARDNGMHWFRHLREERPDARVYYVIEKGCEQRAVVADLGRVVAHSSWRHRLLLLHAEVLAGAYSMKYLLPRTWNAGAYSRHAAWRLGAVRVYLKHGVQMNTNALRRRMAGYHLYVTATEGESAAVRAYSGYDAQVALTGLPRYDALEPTPPSRTVLFMPTWRAYLVPRLFSGSSEGQVAYEGSTYKRFMHDFLSDPRLAVLLREHGYRMTLMPHYNMDEKLADVPLVEGIDVVSGGSADIQQLMRSCDLFVTDHSSVHFDLAFLGTPVVYTHFDVEEYYAGHAERSWFEHERDGFGPVVHDVDGTLAALEAYLATGCRREPLYEERAASAFVHRDRHNNERVTRAVDALVERSR